jgi:hypothetical protein
MNIKVPYGYKSMRVSSLNIYTIKLRLKISESDLVYKFKNDISRLINFSERVKAAGTYTTITFATFSDTEYNTVYTEVNRVVAEIKHERVDRQHGVHTEDEPREVHLLDDIDSYLAAI